MKMHILVLAMCIVSCVGCDSNTKLKSMTNEQMNKILAQIDETSSVFVQKDVAFDSIVTAAGSRFVNDREERMKIKLFYFGNHTRGYYNLSDKDDKNLQVFGQKVDGRWTLKCVTKLSGEEADGYLFFNDGYQGLWSNGSVNFVQGTFNMVKQNKDYADLKSW